MHKIAKLGVAGVALVVLLTTSCSKSNTAGTGSSSIPLPPTSALGAAAGASTTVAASQASTPGPKPGRPASCDLSDTWSYAILDAYNKGANLAPTEKLVINDRLDKSSAALKQALPQYATEIDSRTTKAKGAMDGKPSDTSPPGNEYDTWYKSTCLTS